MNEKTARADKSTDPIMPMSGMGVHLVLIIDGNQHAVSLKDTDCAAIASRARRHEAVAGILAAGMPYPPPPLLAHRIESLERDLADANALYIQSRVARATHRCKVCGAKWILLENNTWTLASKICGVCCNNVEMADQIEAIGLTARVSELERVRDAVCEHRDQLRQQVELFRSRLTVSENNAQIEINRLKGVISAGVIIGGDEVEAKLRRVAAGESPFAVFHQAPIMQEALAAYFATIDAQRAGANIKPFLYGIADPFNSAYIDEACVAPRPGDLSEEVDALNHDKDMPPHRVVAMFTEDQVADLRRRLSEAEAMVQHNLEVAQRAEEERDMARLSVKRLTSATMVTEKDVTRYFMAKCRDQQCGWVGISRDCSGGDPIADTGDHSDILCPVCNHDVDDGDEEQPTVNAASLDQLADAVAMNRRLLGERDAFCKEGKRAQAEEKRLRHALETMRGEAVERGDMSQFVETVAAILAAPPTVAADVQGDRIHFAVIGPDGYVHYTRPEGEKLLDEARSAPGYGVVPMGSPEHLAAVAKALEKP